MKSKGKMDQKFRILVNTHTPRPITQCALQKMRQIGLFRSLGDKTTSNRKSIKINGQNAANGTDKVCAALIPGDDDFNNIQCKRPILKVCIFVDFTGFQGVATNDWYTFGANLSIPTYLIPLMKSKNATSIAAIAESIFGTVCELFTNQKEFYIIGYSFGTVVAIQLAQMLERTGMRGRILLIDGSLTYLQKTFAPMMPASSSSEEVIEDLLIMLMYFNLCSCQQTYELIDRLQNCENFTKKFDMLCYYLPEELTSEYSMQYLRNIMTAMSNRLKAIIPTNADDNEDLSKIVKLKSPVTLVRPTQVPIVDCAKDYDLSKYAEQTIEVKYIKGNYLQMLNSQEVTQIINEFAPTK